MALHRGHARRKEAVVGMLTTYDMSGYPDIARWAWAEGLNPEAMTIEQACAALNATRTDAVFTVSPDARGLHVRPVAPVWPGSITIVGREPNPLRHNPLTPDPADEETYAHQTMTEQDLSQAILSVISESEAPLSNLDMIRAKVQERLSTQISRSAVDRQVWRLLDQSSLELNSKRHIVLRKR